MTIREFLKKSEDPEKLRYLMMAREHWSFRDFLLREDEDIPEELSAYLLSTKESLRSGVPLQYIAGEAPFFGRDFRVDSRVLIPRFDTEILVEEALDTIDHRIEDRNDSRISVLDLCTGSGCIGITIALERPNVSVTLSDVSDDALSVAKINAERFGLSLPVVKSSYFDSIPGSFHVIVTNPPYIRDDVIETLDKEVRDHEPRIALSGGADGLSAYREIITKSTAFLRKNGTLLTEIGYDQGGPVSEMFQKAGFRNVSVKKDLAGHDRVVKGTL